MLTDACCIAARRCGDGLVRSDKALGEAGYEACDDGNERPGDDCSVECLIDDHGNQIGSASVLTLEENLENYVQLLPTDSIPSARIDDISDADFLSLTVTKQAFIDLTSTPRSLRPNLSPAPCRRVTVGFQSDRTDTDRGCSVDTYLAAADTIYLEIARQTGAPFDYTVSLQKPCGNGLVDAGEDCDPEAPGSNALRCRRDCRKRRMLTLAGTTGCAAVNGGVKCWGSNAGLIMGRTIDSRRTCEKIGSDPWYGENTFNVDVAPFVVDVVNPQAYLTSAAGMRRSARHGSDGRTYCWAGRSPRTRACLEDERCHDPVPGQCQDDRSHVNNGRVIGGCLPAPVLTLQRRQWDNLLTTDVEGDGRAHSKCLVRTTGQVPTGVLLSYLRNGMLGSDIARDGLAHTEGICYNLWYVNPYPIDMPDAASIDYLAIGIDGLRHPRHRPARLLGA